MSLSLNADIPLSLMGDNFVRDHKHNWLILILLVAIEIIMNIINSLMGRRDVRFKYPIKDIIIKYILIFKKLNIYKYLQII